MAKVSCLQTIWRLSYRIPSLSILFETLIVARKDLLNFTAVTMFIMVAVSLGYHMIFGYNQKDYSTSLESMYQQYFLMIGNKELPNMVKNRSQIGLVVYAFFAFFFVLYVIGMYTAIIVRTYVKLKERKMLISEAMSRLIFDETLNGFHMWVNLFCFRKPNRS